MEKNGNGKMEGWVVRLGDVTLPYVFFGDVGPMWGVIYGARNVFHCPYEIRS